MSANGINTGHTTVLEPVNSYILKPAIGFLWFQGKELPRTVYDIYSMEGFERWTKVWASDMRLLYFIIPATKGLFDKCLETLKLQTDLYYLSSFISSTADMLANKNGERSKKLKIIGAAGNIFQVLKVLQKHGVFSFSKCTELANYYGSYQVFGKPLGQWPLLRNTLFDKPKDGCIFIIAFFESIELIVDAFEGRSSTIINDWEKRYKLVGHLGKMVLIGCAPYYTKMEWYAWTDFITQHVSLFGFILKKQRDRDERFNLTKRIAAPSA